MTTFDEKCWQLAQHFLDDETVSPRERDRLADDLAVTIQNAIESWIEVYRGRDDCDCAAETTGKWANIHSPGCATLKGSAPR